MLLRTCFTLAGSQNLIQPVLPAQFTVDGVLNRQPWMLAGKARLFGDDDALERILVAPDPKERQSHRSRGSWFRR